VKSSNLATLDQEFNDNYLQSKHTAEQIKNLLLKNTNRFANSNADVDANNKDSKVLRNNFG
jgi:hypothetical protein